jgi:hypothetical protein
VAESYGRREWDAWAIALFLLHVGQALLVARLYPWLTYDTDLLGYFVYFRNWIEGTTGLHGIAFFPVPKPLLVFLLGPLGRPSWAFACSAIASGALGVVVYRVGRDAFGRTVGVLTSLLLLLDAEKAVLAVRSKADLHLALLLFIALHLAMRRRLVASAVCLFLSALVKPVTLPCALFYLVADGARRTRWLCALVPLAAVPLVLLSNRVLVGAALAPAHFFAGFTALRDAAAIGPGEVLHFVVWTQLVKHAFVATAAWGFVGLGLWLARDRRRLTSPLLLFPLLFLGGYLLLGVVSPYTPFFRFYWPVQAWFLGFILFAMTRTTRWLAGGRRHVALALTAVLVLFVANDEMTAAAGYRTRLAQPFEQAMEFVSTTTDVLRAERRAGETIEAPITFVPYLMLELGIRQDGVILAAGAPSGETAQRRPDWLFYLPEPDGPGDGLARLVAEAGYEVRLSDGKAALLALPATERSPMRTALGVDG